MTTFILLAAAVLLLLAAVATVHAVHTDGRGHLPPVRSHPGWDESGPDRAAEDPPARSAFSTLPYLP